MCVITVTATTFIIRIISETFPHMLYEGHSCIYGGLYLTFPMYSTDPTDPQSEFSRCTTSNNYLEVNINQGTNIALVIIYYSGYSAEKLIFDIQVCWRN